MLADWRLQPDLVPDSRLQVPGAPPTDTSLVVNAVWSDPGLDLGCTFNSTRGGGSVWGPDVTRRFLGKYGLKQLVRSHECTATSTSFQPLCAVLCCAVL